MKFKNLTKDDIDLIRIVYEKSNSREEAQKKLSDIFNVSKRTIRNWAYKIGVGRLPKNVDKRILLYDIETSRIPAMVWWTGKQYVNHTQLKGEPKIITISWKWFGDDVVKSGSWDKNQSDRKVIEEFLKDYNKADLVVGYNNDSFDNRWMNARAMKYGLYINTFVRSLDIMKQSKRLFRLPSYSLNYLLSFLGLESKLEHEGIEMWDKIQFGDKEESKKALEDMIKYNTRDVLATEEVFLSLSKYLGMKAHLGVAEGKPKWTCPLNGSYNVSLHKTTWTPAGTVQRIMKCNDIEHYYKISNKSYMDFLNWKMKQKYN